MSRLGSRLESLERQLSSEEPCCPHVTYYEPDGTPIAQERAAPCCPHGRPWLRIAVRYYEAGDRDERA